MSILYQHYIYVYHILHSEGVQGIYYYIDIVIIFYYLNPHLVIIYIKI